MLKEKIIETKICKHCLNNFDVTDKDLEFYEKISPVFNSPSPSDIPLKGGGTKGGVIKLENGKIKYLIPSPTLCPQCREQRRFSWRNERNLYKRKCDFSGKDIISIYSPEKPYKVYDQEIWWSDTWGGALDYGYDFDFLRPFFNQFDELMKEVPLYALLNSNTENAEFNNYIYSAKNCYMSYVVYYEPENIYYSNRVYGGNNVIDCSSIYYSENCYDCYYSIKCFNCCHSSIIHSCQNCYYSRNLEGCDFCIGCANLINKKYHIFNQSVSKEIFEETLKKINDKSFINDCLNFITSQIYRSTNNLECKNCSGDYLRNCKNVFDSYDTEGSEDCRFLLAENMVKCYDGMGGRSEYCYEFTRVGWGKNNLFSNDVMESSNIIYSFQVYYSNNCFGCVGVRNKEYCILNKQYTKEEYEALVPKIIEHMMKTGEWGEFFPSSLSPFGYNETVAQEYYPINPPVLTDIPLIKGDSQNGVEAGGLSYIDREGNTYKTLQEAGKRPVFKWSTYEAPFPKVDKIIPASKLPSSISDIPDDILNWAIECEVTKKPFRIIKQELEFYRKHNILIPKKHPDQRYFERIKLRSPRKLFTRKCDKCGKEIQTTYALERSEIVYCEECYNNEIY